MAVPVVTESVWWVQHGYLAGKSIGGDVWICLARMLYTWRVMLCTDDFVYGFACYTDPDLARAAYDAWDGTGLPLAGYTRVVHLDDEATP